MIENCTTDGEQLCKFLNARFLASAPWSELKAALEPTGRPSEHVDFFRQVAAVAMTGRIVSAGTSFAQTLPPRDPAFRSELTTHLRECVHIPYRHLDEVFRFSQRAIIAALQPLANSTKNRLRDWALRRHSHCYMCGVSLLFDVPDQISSYSCEHVWPQAYGGNGIIDNLLPACTSCNSKKKAHFATWTMPAVQSLILGLSPESTRLQEIPGSYKFALHYRAAQSLALKKRLTLKEAFLKLGPWHDVRILDRSDVADIFNLANHAPDALS
jgi:hypothetical protein